MSDIKDQMSSIWLEIRETIRLNVDYAKLTGAEKATTLLSACVIALVGILIGSVTIFFISAAIVELISDSTGKFGACLIMAGIYIVMFGLLCLFRKPLVINPIARFISKLLMK